MLTKFNIIGALIIQGIFSHFWFQRYFGKVNQVIHFLAPVFQKGKFNIKTFMMILVLLVKYSDGYDHKKAWVALVSY